MIFNSKERQAESSRQNQNIDHEGLSINDLSAQPFLVDKMALGLSDSPVVTIQKKEANAKGGNSFGPIPEDIRSKMESSFSSDFSEVNIHTASSMASQMGAYAFTQGNDIHFAPGKFDPTGSNGQQLLAHELTHVVQQRSGKVKPTVQSNGIAINDNPSLEKEADIMGAKATRGEKNVLGNSSSGNISGTSVVQGYFPAKHNSQSFKISDDLSTAVKVGYPNHILFAKPGMAASANTKLKAVSSGIELQETSVEETFTDGKKSEKLKQVLPKNTQNSTQGDTMDLWADCGKSNAVVVGGSSRKASYNDGSTTKWTAAGSPANMKAEIMKNWLTKKYSDVNTPTLTKTKIKATLDGAKTIESKIAQLVSDYNKAKTQPEKDTIIEKYQAAKDELAEKLWEYYNGLPSTTKESIDKELAINRYARPSIGEGFTISSGGSPVSGYENNTWNFHWGGVVLESTDTKDKVVLENYAVGDPSVENNDWEFAMYGTVKKGQTFHDVHSGTNQHGTTPTTMRINKA